MIETRLPTAWPPNELRIPSEMLDVALAAVLSAILSSVETCLLAYPCPQVVVASQTGIGVEPLAGRVAFTAIRIALELGVCARELSGR